MWGSIAGDIIGSPYEFNRGEKTKKFPLFSTYSKFTDDTAMTVAVADALMHMPKNVEDKDAHKVFVEYLQKWYKKYPQLSYGGRFFYWLRADNPKPYGSYGNGSAMRVSSVGWLFDNLKDVKRFAKLSAEITHDHPEGIRGAQAIACAIFLARTKKDKKYIKDYIEGKFHYNLNTTCEEIRKTNTHVETCQKTVPQALVAFLESDSFEDAIRNAVSLGGDSDTIACMTGGIAEAYYGVPLNIRVEVHKRLPQDIRSVISSFYATIRVKNAK